jgi:hypothetical protein
MTQDETPRMKAGSEPRLISNNPAFIRVNPRALIPRHPRSGFIVPLGPLMRDRSPDSVTAPDRRRRLTARVGSGRL